MRPVGKSLPAGAGRWRPLTTRSGRCVSWPARRWPVGCNRRVAVPATHRQEVRAVPNVRAWKHCAPPHRNGRRWGNRLGGLGTKNGSNDADLVTLSGDAQATTTQSGEASPPESGQQQSGEDGPAVAAPVDVLDVLERGATSAATWSSSASAPARWASSTPPTIPSWTARSRSSSCAPSRADAATASRRQARLVREAKAIARLSHPNVVAHLRRRRPRGPGVHGHGAPGGRHAARLAGREEAPVARDPRDVHRGRPRPGRRPRRGADPPRLQARQRPPRQERRAQGRRLRPGAAVGGRRRDDQRRRRPRPSPPASRAPLRRRRSRTPR